MERLQKDMGTVPLDSRVAATGSGDAEVSGPSDLIFMRGNPDQEEDDMDSDTDDIDHHVTEESKEGQAFKNFLKERKEVVHARNRKLQ